MCVLFNKFEQFEAELKDIVNRLFSLKIVFAATLKLLHNYMSIYIYAFLCSTTVIVFNTYLFYHQQCCNC